MYKEIAFDPSCMGSMEYYGLVKQHFGYDHGRYISADIKSWAAEAIKHVKKSGLQEIKAKSIKNYLNKLARSKKCSEFHLASDRSKLKKVNWVDWYEEQISIRPFSLVISETIDDVCASVDKINSGLKNWNVDRSISVIKDGQAIIEAVSPLLDISERITLIDQHFRLGNNKTLLNLLRYLNSCSLKKLVIVTAMDSPDSLNVFTREYGEMRKDNLEIIWFKAPEKFFHDRYLISEVGAVRSGHGFMADVQKGTHADQTNLNIISKEESERTLSDFESLKEKGEIIELFRV